MTIERDDEILRLMDEEHLRPKTIAYRLGISASTVSRAWRRAYERQQAAKYADDEDDE